MKVNMSECPDLEVFTKVCLCLWYGPSSLSFTQILEVTNANTLLIKDKEHYDVGHFEPPFWHWSRFFPNPPYSMILINFTIQLLFIHLLDLASLKPIPLDSTLLIQPIIYSQIPLWFDIFCRCIQSVPTAFPIDPRTLFLASLSPSWLGRPKKKKLRDKPLPGRNNYFVLVLFQTVKLNMYLLIAIACVISLS